MKLKIDIPIDHNTLPIRVDNNPIMKLKIDIPIDNNTLPIHVDSYSDNNSNIVPSSRISKNYINELIHEYINHTNCGLNSENVKSKFNYFQTTNDIKQLKNELISILKRDN